MTHDKLAESLAGHLRAPDRMVWQDMQLGPVGSPRPDVYAIFKSYTKPAPMAFECKVSVSDFRADVTSGKWESYCRYAYGVAFACEAGLIGKADVPAQCGLIVRHASGAWRWAKRPTLQPTEIPRAAWMKLLIDGVEREGPRVRARHFSSDVMLLKSQFSQDVAKVIRDIEAARRDVEYAQRRAEQIVQAAEATAKSIRDRAAEDAGPLYLRISRALGLPETAPYWQVRNAVERLEHPSDRHVQLTVAVQEALRSYGAG